MVNKEQRELWMDNTSDNYSWGVATGVLVTVFFIAPLMAIALLLNEIFWQAIATAGWLSIHMIILRRLLWRLAERVGRDWFELTAKDKEREGTF